MAVEIKGVVPTLAVTDLDRAREFYGGVLELEEAEGESMEEGGLMFRAGDGSRLYLYKRPQPAGSSATVCAFSVDDVERLVKSLREKGARFEEYDLPEMGLKTEGGIAQLDGARSAWLKDPFGNIIAFDDTRAAKTKRAGQSRGEEAEARH